MENNKYFQVDNSATKTQESYFLVRGAGFPLKEFRKATIEESKIAAEKYLAFLITNSLMLNCQNYPYEVRGGFSFSLVLVEMSEGYKYQEKTVRVIDEKTMVI